MPRLSPVQQSESSGGGNRKRGSQEVHLGCPPFTFRIVRMADVVLAGYKEYDDCLSAANKNENSRGSACRKAWEPSARPDRVRWLWQANLLSLLPMDLHTRRGSPFFFNIESLVQSKKAALFKKPVGRHQLPTFVA